MKLTNTKKFFVTGMIGAALFLTGCSVNQTEEARLPDVDVKADSGQMPEYEVTKTQEGELPSADADVKDDGNMPEYDVDTADVDVTTEEKQVEVPDVDVTTETETVGVPDVDLEMPNENDNS